MAPAAEEAEKAAWPGGLAPGSARPRQEEARRAFACPYNTHPVTLLPFCQWLADTRGSIALHESLYMYPLVESLHVLTLCLFLGMAILFDLRLLGLALWRVPITEMKGCFGPWMLAGFVVMVISGAALFYAIPIRSYQSIFF